METDLIPDHAPMPSQPRRNLSIPLLVISLIVWGIWITGFNDYEGHLFVATNIGVAAGALFFMINRRRRSELIIILILFIALTMIENSFTPLYRLIYQPRALAQLDTVGFNPDGLQVNLDRDSFLWVPIETLFNSDFYTPKELFLINSRDAYSNDIKIQDDKIIQDTLLTLTTSDGTYKVTFAKILDACLGSFAIYRDQVLATPQGQRNPIPSIQNQLHVTLPSYVKISGSFEVRSNIAPSHLYCGYTDGGFMARYNQENNEIQWLNDDIVIPPTPLEKIIEP